MHALAVLRVREALQLWAESGATPSAGPGPPPARAGPILSNPDFRRNDESSLEKLNINRARVIDDLAGPMPPSLSHSAVAVPLPPPLRDIRAAPPHRHRRCAPLPHARLPC